MKVGFPVPPRRTEAILEVEMVASPLCSTAPTALAAAPVATSSGPEQPTRHSTGDWHRTAEEIRRQLAQLRRHVRGLEADQLGMPVNQLQALVAGYDIYARMLDDALTDITVRLDATGGAPATPAGLFGPGGRR
jgi:hypothetical protein